VKLTRQDSSPVQVAVADEVLDRDPLGGNELFLDLDPTSACVAAAHWLQAAADLASRVSGHDPTAIVMVADDISAVPVATPTEVLERLVAGQTPTAVVTSMIRDAMAVATGQVPDVEELFAALNTAVELADEHATDDRSRAVILSQTG
jgi:hypothetical protein